MNYFPQKKEKQKKSKISPTNVGLFLWANGKILNERWKFNMKKTLRNTLTYLFEAEQTMPAGNYRINDELSLKVTPRLEHRFASFSVVRNKEPEIKTTGLSLAKRQELRISAREASASEIKLSDAEIKRIMGIVVGYLRKHKIKDATISLGKSATAVKGIQAFRKYFGKSTEYEESSVVNTSPSTFINVTKRLSDEEKAKKADKPKKERKPKEPKERKRPQSVFDDSGENVGVKRIYKIEKDASGKVIKKYTKIFPKYATVQKLIYTLKRQDGGTVDIYNYSTRRDAGLLKKKLTWKEKQHKAEIEDMDKIRTTPEKEVKGMNEDYLALKRELRNNILEELKKRKNQGVAMPDGVDKLVRGNINLSLGKFNVETDWRGYSETRKDAIVRKTVRAVRYKYHKVFK